jgi:hypothetical protein
MYENEYEDEKPIISRRSWIKTLGVSTGVVALETRTASASSDGYGGGGYGQGAFGAGTEQLDAATFDIVRIDTNSPIEAGERFVATVTVTNGGDLRDTKYVTLSVPGVGSTTTTIQLAGGASTTVELALSTSVGDAGDYTVAVETPDDSDSTSVTIVAQPDPAQFDITLIDTNSPIKESETLTVAITVTNVGDLADTKDVTLSVPGVGTTTQSVQLDSGASTTVELTLSTSVGDASDYTVAVKTPDDSNSTSVTIVAQPDPAQFDITLIDTNSPIKESETLTVAITVTNVGDLADTKDVTLSVPGVGTTTQSVQLAGGASTTVELDLPTSVGDVGDYVANVGTSDEFRETRVTIKSGGPSVSDYTTTQDVVDSTGLRNAFGDWQKGDINSTLLRDVFDAWQSGDIRDDDT